MLVVFGDEMHDAAAGLLWIGAAELLVCDLLSGDLADDLRADVAEEAKPDDRCSRRSRFCWLTSDRTKAININPIPNRDLSLSVIGEISFGGLSLENTICLCVS